MNPNVPGRMSPGCAYKSRLGILGIQAVSMGEAAFNSFASSLATAWGVTYSVYWQGPTTSLSGYGFIRLGTYVLVFFAGATSADHGTMVLGGMSDERRNSNYNGFNASVCLAIDNEFNSYVSSWVATITEFFVFGHSYGGVEAECFGDVFAALYPAKSFYVETYGAPRCVIPSLAVLRANLLSTRNVNREDVVSHIPYHADEAPLASRFLLTTVRNSFTASGHPRRCRVFNSDGTFEDNQNNNVFSVSDTTLSILLWVCYANHLTHRSHELATYVAVMNAFAVTSPTGTLPPASETSTPAITVSPAGPVSDGPLIGVIPPVAAINAAQENQEDDAREKFNRFIFPDIAIAVSSAGVHSAGFRGQNTIPCSSRRRAKGMAKLLNRIRRLMGPLTTEQRALVVDAVGNELLPVDES